MPRAATHAARAAPAAPPAARSPRTEAARRTRARHTATPPRRTATPPRHAATSPRRTATSARHAAPRRPRAIPRQRIARAAGAKALRLPVRSANGLVDRAVRGRVWVALIGVLLVGIVFLNVSLLQLNGEIARMSEQADELKRQNSDLRSTAARLGSTERILRLAERQGFAMPAPGAVTYLEADPEVDAARAARALGASPTLAEQDTAAETAAVR